MLYSGFKEKCRKDWSDKLNKLCIDLTKIKTEANYRIFNESKNTYNESIPENEAF